MTYPAKYLVALSAVLAVSLSTGHAAGGTEPDRRMGQLSNGIRVVLIHQNPGAAPAVAIVVSTGSADDPVSKGGLSHLVEHVLFLESLHISKTLQDRVLSERTIRTNAITATDSTIFTAMGPPGSLETQLWFLSDKLIYSVPTLTSERLAVAKTVVQNEIAQSTASSLSVLDKLLLELLFSTGHPYRERPTEGIDHASILDVQSFYYDHYSSSAITLVVASDLDFDASLALTERYFMSLPRRDAIEHPIIPGPKNTQALQTVYLDIDTPVVGLGWQGPPGLSADDVSLDVLLELLNGDEGVLRESLVKNTKLAANVRCWRSSRRVSSPFACFAQAAAGVSLARVTDGLIDVIRNLQQHGPSPATLRAAKKRWAKSMILSRESAADYVSYIGWCASMIGNASCDMASVDAIDKLGVDDFKRLAAQWLDLGNSVTLSALPAAQRK